MRTIAINETHREIALERLYGNAEVVAEWLSGECDSQTTVGVHHLPNKLADAPVAELLLVALFEDGDKPAQALKALRARYMAAEGAARLQRYEDEAAESDDGAGEW